MSAYKITEHTIGSVSGSLCHFSDHKVLFVLNSECRLRAHCALVLAREVVLGCHCGPSKLGAVISRPSQLRAVGKASRV